MRQNFKLLCCAAYIVNLIVSKLQTPLLCCLYCEFDCLNLSVLLAEFVVFGRIFSRIP